MSGRIIDKTIVNGVTLVSLAGELDLSDGPLVRRALCRTSAGLPDVALDLREVDFIDCAVAGALVGVSRQVRSAGGCLRLTGLRPSPLRLVTLCGLDAVMCVHDTTAGATAARCTAHVVTDLRTRTSARAVRRTALAPSATPV